MKTRILCRAIAPALLLLASVPRAAAITLTYDPVGVSTQWSDPANWTGGAPGDFPNSAMFDAILGGSETATLSTDITIGGLTFTITPVATTTVSGGGSTLTVVNTTAVAGAALFTQGAFSLNALTIAGSVTAGAGVAVSATNTTVGDALGDVGVVAVGNGGQFTNAGTFTLMNGSSISTLAGGGTFLNSGNFFRSGDNGSANITASFQDSGAGSITNNSAGTLRFGGPTLLTGSNVVVNAGGLTVFAGTSTIHSTQITLSNGGEVYFEGGNHTLTGTLTVAGDGTGTEVTARSSAIINGGTLDFAASAPFVMNNATLGGTATVTNIGDFRWRGGNIRGVDNNAATPGRFVITALADPTPRVIVGGVLRNAGHMTIDGASFQIGTDGILRNDAGATLLINGAVASDQSGATNGVIENNGALTKSTAGAATFFTDFKNAAAATIVLNGGSLTLRGETTLAGSITVDRATDASAEFTISSSSPTVSNTLNAPTFTLNGLATTTPLVTILSGTQRLSGTMSFMGTGLVQQAGGTLEVQAGNTGTIQTSATARYRLDGSTPSILTDGVLTNEGNFEWDSGTISGPEEFLNSSSGTLTITGAGSPVLSDGTGGRLENFGLLTVQTGNSLRMKNGATIVNFAGGGAQRFEMNGNNSGIAKFDGTVTTALFQNRGALVRDGSGSSTISVPFEQVTPGSTEVRAGALVLSGGYDITGGSFSVLGATSVLRMNSSGSMSGVPMNFTGGGVFEFGAPAVPPTHTLSGLFQLSGSGRIEQKSGTVLVEATKQVIMQSAAGTSYRLNGADAFLRANGTFRNQGTFDWLTGIIAGSGEVTNEAGAVLTLSGGGFRYLSDGAGGKLTNSGTLLVNANLFMGEGAILQNSENMDLRADILRVGGTTTGKVLNFDTLLVSSGVTIGTDFDNYDRTLVNGVPLRLTGKVDLAGGTVIVDFPGGHVDMSDAESLNISAGAQLISNNGGRFTFNKTTNPPKIIQTVGDLRVNEAGQAIINNSQVKSTPGNTGKLSTTGSGTITQNGGTLGGAGTVEVAGNYTGNNVTTTGAVTVAPGGSVTLNGGTLAAGAGSTFTSAGNLALLNGGIGGNMSLLSSSFATFQNPNATIVAPQSQIQNAGTIEFNGLGNVTLDTDAIVRNLATGLIEIGGTGTFISVPGATNVVIENAGSFVKTSAGTTAIGVPVTNTGTVAATAGTLDLAAGLAQLSGGTLSAGTYIASNGATISALAPQVVTTIGADSTVELRGAGSKVFNIPHLLESNALTVSGTASFFDTTLFADYVGGIGTVTGSGGADLNVLLIDVQTGGILTLNSGATITGDTFRLESGGSASISGGASITVDSLIVEPGAIFGGISGGSANIALPATNQGTVSGNLTFTAPLLTNVFGFAPGNSAGLITINGDFTQTGTGFLDMEIGGLTPGTGYDWLDVNGDITLAGTLNVSILPGAVGLPAGSTFTILTGDTISGTFGTLNFPLDGGGDPLFSIQYNATNVQLTALETIPEPSSALLLLGGIALLARRRK